jgi:predicted GIY-YIG superfamily endonuclease
MYKNGKKRHWRWTKELIIAEAKKYDYRSDFKKKEPNLYKSIIKGGYAEEAFSHMLFKPRKWTYEKCIEAAKTCKTKSEFGIKFCGAYATAKSHNWLSDIIKNFEPVGSKVKRCIYAYEFSDNSVYVGLTFSLKKRNMQHMRDLDSSVYQHIKETNIKPVLVQKTDYIDYKEAAQKEGEILNEYKENGWFILNKTKTGGLGSSIEKKEKVKIHKQKRFKWTEEALKKEIEKYKTLSDFRTQSPNAYSICSRKKLLNTLCVNLKRQVHETWTMEEAKKEALKYHYKKDFEQNSHGCYSSCRNKGWLEIVCVHMGDYKKENSLYNEENVKEVVSRYTQMQKLKKSEDKFERGCYWWLKKKKLLIEYKKYLKK